MASAPFKCNYNEDGKCKRVEALNQLCNQVHNWALKNEFSFVKIEFSIGAKGITNMRLSKSLVPGE